MKEFPGTTTDDRGAPTQTGAAIYPVGPSLIVPDVQSTGTLKYPEQYARK
jgi:hypothetical protein